jgi:threonine-phosphate decarboxylase
MRTLHYVPDHGGQRLALAKEYGFAPDAILDFSANINPDGPPEAVIQVLRSAIDDHSSLTLYPDLELSELRSAIAAFHHIDPAAVIVTNGFVPLLEAVLQTLMPERCLLPVPAFSEYRRTLERCNIQVLPQSLQTDDFLITQERFKHAAQQAGADAILLANPQNPASVLTPANVIRDLVSSLPEMLFLLDEAFIDYAPQESLAAEAPSLANLIVFRSVTKFFAMPGLRVAYAIAGPDRATKIRRQIAPWPVSTLADLAVRAALLDTDYQRLTRDRNAARRTELAAALAEIGVSSLPAAANFLLLQVPRDAESVRERLLRDHAIHLRSCVNFESLHGQFLRTAVRDQGDNRRLVQAIAAVLSAP